MKLRFFPLLFVLALAFAISGCLVTPVEKSGGIGSVTVKNSNPAAIINSAQNVFSNYGYSLHNTHFPESVSFDQSDNKTARILWGSYGYPQTVRVKVQIVHIPRTSNYRISPKVYTISDAGVAGFESKRPLLSLWNSQYSGIFEKIAERSSGAGGY